MSVENKLTIIEKKRQELHRAIIDLLGEAFAEAVQVEVNIHLPDCQVKEGAENAPRLEVCQMVDELDWKYYQEESRGWYVNPEGRLVDGDGGIVVYVS